MPSTEDYNVVTGRLDDFDGRRHSTVKFVSVKSAADLVCPHCSTPTGLTEFRNMNEYECMKCNGRFVLTVHADHKFKYVATALKLPTYLGLPPTVDSTGSAIGTE